MKRVFREQQGWIARTAELGRIQEWKERALRPGIIQRDPEGYPRGRKLLSLAKVYGSEEQAELAARIIQAAWSVAGERPNLDFGLATFARALGLPSEAPITIFALGRTVGWIAHAVEQYADNQPIRPRARYVSPVPTGS